MKFPLWIRITIAPIRIPISLLAMIFALCCVLVGEEAEDFGDLIVDFCIDYGNKEDWRS